jgi:hypothetical protein
MFVHHKNVSVFLKKKISAITPLPTPTLVLKKKHAG